jgi:hypothetical protein
MFSNVPTQKIDDLGTLLVTQRVEDSIVITSTLKILLGLTSDENWNVSFSFSIFRFFYSLTVNSSNLPLIPFLLFGGRFLHRVRLSARLKNKHRNHCRDTYSQDEVRSKDAKGMFSSMPIQKIDNLGRVPVT